MVGRVFQRPDTRGQMPVPIKFGTDGWRAIIADDFTFDNVALCAQGVAAYTKANPSPERGLLVGYDTRFASPDFAARTAEVFAANGIPTLLCDKPTPTPVVTYNVLSRHTAGAAVITASHNPPQWNGFKFKPDYAGSASPEIIAQIEEQIAQAQQRPVSRLPLEQALSNGAVKMVDATLPYMKHLAKFVDLDSLKRSGLNIAVDAMHGAGAGYLPALLDGARGVVTEIRGEYNPTFPGMQQPEPIAHNLGPLSDLVVQSNADVGIAYDGDADRLGIIDERGRYLSTLQVFALLALYLLEARGERGPIVKSLTSSSMLFRLGQLFEVPVMETGVGFKFASPLMLKENALMAGEESGGYAFRGHIPERDGILSSLLLLDFMVRMDKRPSELLQHLFDRVGEHHFGRRDIAFEAQARPKLEQSLSNGASASEIAGLKVTSVDTIEGVRFHFNQSWLAIRFSGTEPLVRIYAEADHPDRVNALLDGAAALLGT